MAGRVYLYAVSLGAHAILGACLAGIPQKVRHEIIAISMTESKPTKVTPPPPAPAVAEPEPVAAPVKAKAAPASAPKPEIPAAAPPPSPTPAANVPDFGLSLSNAAPGGAGLAVPAGDPGGVTRARAPAAKTLTRTLAHAVEDCTEPPTKPKALSRPMPVYPEAARSAGITGKVRVEITVDATGAVSAVRILEGLGHGLDEACLTAARAMTFEPAMRCGKATSATLKVGFAF